MVLVAGGTFTMGWLSKERDGDCYDNEKPAHEVTLDDFYIGRYEVTQAQWRAVMGSNPRNYTIKAAMIVRWKGSPGTTFRIFFSN
jgi:sulfatase modifying factor 1